MIRVIDLHSSRRPLKPIPQTHQSMERDNDLHVVLGQQGLVVIHPEQRR